jgi:hypothetical protein
MSDLLQAQADLKLAQQNHEKYQSIAVAEIAQAQSRVDFAQEKYNKDKELADAGALPRRDALESQTQLAQALAELVKAQSRRDVIQAENQLQRSQAAVTVAKERIKPSNSTELAHRHYYSKCYSLICFDGVAFLWDDSAQFGTIFQRFQPQNHLAFMQRQVSIGFPQPLLANLRRNRRTCAATTLLLDSAFTSQS